MSRFIISCGGTGGHLSPGISLAEGLRARGHETTLLISQKKVDARLSEKYPQLRFERMPGSGFALHPWKLAKCIVSRNPINVAYATMKALMSIYSPSEVAAKRGKKIDEILN